MKQKPTALGVSIFAGGFTVGMSKHFQVMAHLEESAYGVATVRRNFPKLPVAIGHDNWDLRPYKGVELIYGNPPCAAWSINGKNKGANSWRGDPRIECTRRHFNLIEPLRPTIWVWESVVPAFIKGRPFVDELTELGAKLGYSATYVLHDAQYLGLPQRRPRFFMVLHKVAIPWTVPTRWEPLTVGEVLAKIKPIGAPASDSGNNAKIFPPSVLKKIRPGQRLTAYWNNTHPEDEREYKENGAVRGRPAFGHIKLPLDKVGPATVGYAMAHPKEPRFCTINEVAALAGFPPGYEFVCGTSANGNAELDLIARGVCPTVGAWLGKQLAAGIAQNKRINKPRQEIFDVRTPPGALYAADDHPVFAATDRSIIK